MLWGLKYFMPTPKRFGLLEERFIFPGIGKHLELENETYGEYVAFSAAVVRKT